MSADRRVPLSTLRSITRQATLTITRRPLHGFLTAVGVALGVAVLVGTTGLAATLNSAVNATFDQLQATRLTVNDSRTITKDPLFDIETIDADLAALANVTSGGMLQPVGEANVQASGTAPPVAIGIVLATPGGIAASQAQLATGRIYDEAAPELGTPQVLLGASAAATLYITDARPGRAIIINGVPATVAGILADYGSEPQLGQAIIIHPGLQESIGLYPTAAAAALVRTELGAARTVAAAVPLALRPQDPESVGVSYPPDPTGIRDDVQQSLNTMAIGGAGLAILIGGVGIMNAMITAVNERTGEIGLRRALGARPRHIATHILIEGCLLGFLGAVIGVILGALILLGLSAANGWAAVLPAWAWYLPLGGGTLIGAIAGIYPAIHSARLSPAAALRR